MYELNRLLNEGLEAEKAGHVRLFREAMSDTHSSLLKYKKESNN